MADRVGTLLNRSGNGGEEVLIVSRGSVRTRFRRRDELGWNFRVESTDSENVVEVTPKPKPAPMPARRASRPRGQRVAYVRVSAADQNEVNIRLTGVHRYRLRGPAAGIANIALGGQQ